MCPGDKEKGAVRMISSGVGVPRATGERMDTQPHLLVGTGDTSDTAFLDQLEERSLYQVMFFPFMGKVLSWDGSDWACNGPITFPCLPP